jgi:hypothetical protein
MRRVIVLGAMALAVLSFMYSCGNNTANTDSSNYDSTLGTHGNNSVYSDTTTPTGTVTGTTSGMGTGANTGTTSSTDTATTKGTTGTTTTGTGTKTGNRGNSGTSGRDSL